MDDKVERLIEMGIDATPARAALLKANGDLERAIELVFSGNMDIVEEIPPLVDSNETSWPSSQSWQYPPDIIKIDGDEEARGRGQTPKDISNHIPNPEQLKSALEKINQGQWDTGKRPLSWENAGNAEENPPGYLSEEEQLNLALSLSQQPDANMASRHSPYNEAPQFIASGSNNGWDTFVPNSATPYQHGGWDAQFQHLLPHQRTRFDTTIPIILRHSNENFGPFSAFITCLYSLKRIRKLFIEMESSKLASDPPTPIAATSTEGDLMEFETLTETTEMQKDISHMSVDEEVIQIEDTATVPPFLPSVTTLTSISERSLNLNGYWQGERWTEILGDFRNHEAALKLLFSMMDKSTRSYLVIDPLPEFLAVEETTARSQSHADFCRDLALHFQHGIEAYLEQRKHLLVKKGVLDQDATIQQLDEERARILSFGVEDDGEPVDPTPLFHIPMPFLPPSCPDLSTYLDRYFYQNPLDGGFDHPYLFSVADHLILPIVREVHPAGSWGYTDIDRTILSFPKKFRVDKYLYDNREEILHCRRKIYQLTQKEEALSKERKDLAFQDGKTWIEALQRLEDYFSAADSAPEEVERGHFHEDAQQVFSKMKVAIESRLAQIDTEIKDCQQQRETIWDHDTFQKHDPYILNAVLMSDGGRSRKSVWSYVRVEKEDQEQWWRVDDDCVKVDESHVLTDPSGFHLNAGPCMLFYGKQTNAVSTLSPNIKEAIDKDNESFEVELRSEIP